MAVTAQLVDNSSPNRLRYLISQVASAGASVTITTTGAATPDIITDSIGSGVIKKLAKAFADGYGAFAAGAKTQAQARALWLSDYSGASSDPASGDPAGVPSLVPTAICKITPIVETGVRFWSVDANVDGSGVPTIVVTADSALNTSSCYLDIEVPEAIG